MKSSASLSINEKYFQPVSFRNDIFRKFETQFISCFLNNVNIENDLYIEHSTDEYEKAFEVFLNSADSDIKFFIGYTGVGKTTYLKHLFRYKTMGFAKYKKDGVVIPASWDGKKIPDNGFEEAIDVQISNILDNLLEYLYASYEELMLTESVEILKFIHETRPDIITSLTIEEAIFARNSGITIEQAKLQKSKDASPVAFSSSLLKYVLENHGDGKKKLIFIVDDLETLAQHKLAYLLTTYLNVYECMHNSKSKVIVKLIVSMRPHSFRFLRDNFDHKYINGYGNFLQKEASTIVKNEIPDVREILITRFNTVFKKTEKPGNPETWAIAKKVFYEIIASLDDNIIKTITEICHLNIRAVIDCLHMILSNRVWCQNYADYTDHPTVRKSDYRFDIVNVVRTLACGESPVYTGKKDIKFNQQNMTSVSTRPRFDDSDVFIPNLLVGLDSKECDVFSAIIVQYLDGYFSSQSASPPQTEFISKKALCQNLYDAFGGYIEFEKISRTVEYLFCNRIIRKSIVSKDNDETINKLLDNDCVYLTLKGSRLLSMFENDSVLLEIYREDIKRDYEREGNYYRSAYELITENEREKLFEDLINLVENIFYSEDGYLTHISNVEVLSFYQLNFPISNKLLNGIEKSLSRSQNIEDNYKESLSHKIAEVRKLIEIRVGELN